MSQAVYAFKDIKNEVSASGGAFKALAEEVFSKYENVVVYGAAFDENLGVKHIRVDKKQELYLMLGSKYVQSRMDGILHQVINDVQEKKWVLFSGTPCQVDMIKRNLEQKELSTDKVIFIDIICHGTPQIPVWNDFKYWVEAKRKSKIVEFSFRYKKSRWKSYSTMAKLENGKVLINTFDIRRYVELFYSDLTITERCYKCPFASEMRVSDITIGDFWGIRKVIPNFPFHEEVSQVIINSEKGKALFESIIGHDNYVIERCMNCQYVQYQEALTHPTKKPSKTEEFWKEYKIIPFEKILEKYAGYNPKGFIKHIFKKIMGEIGVVSMVKDIIKH